MLYRGLQSASFEDAREVIVPASARCAYLQPTTRKAIFCFPGGWLWNIGRGKQALAAWEALPANDKASIKTKRGIQATYQGLGDAFAKALEDAPSIAACEQANNINRPIAAADPKNTSAQYDLFISLVNEAQTYIDLGNPLLYPLRQDRKENAQRALALLRNSMAIVERLVALDPKKQLWVTNLAYERAMVGTLARAWEILLVALN